jgi:hypothetical protein
MNTRQRQRQHYQRPAMPQKSMNGFSAFAPDLDMPDCDSSMISQKK